MEIKIATWNISGGVSAKVEGDIYFDQKKSSEIDTNFLYKIIDVINNEDIDIICFQEIIITERIGYLDIIGNNTKLKYYKYLELSDCNLVSNTECGIAIFSKFPIKKSDFMIFTNPKLLKTTANGNTYYTYDKGCMSCSININNKIFNIITNHGFPFRRFNSIPEDNLNIYVEFNSFINKFNNRIITGDFNVENPCIYIESLNNLKQLNNNVTTSDNMKFDKIFIESDIKFINFKMLKSYSDHFLLISELEI